MASLSELLDIKIKSVKFKPLYMCHLQGLMGSENNSYRSTNNPVVKVEGRRPETLTTGLFVLSIPGMAT